MWGWHAFAILTSAVEQMTCRRCPTGALVGEGKHAAFGQRGLKGLGDFRNPVRLYEHRRRSPSRRVMPSRSSLSSRGTMTRRLEPRSVFSSLTVACAVSQESARIRAMALA